MQICVCGWYFNERFLDLLTDITKEYPVTIIANRGELPKKYEGVFNYHVRENRGLEYGAYDYFLHNEWSGDDVLFMHDDITIQPIMKNYEIINPILLFKTVANFKQDLVYVFQNDIDRQDCFGIHGRVMFSSKRFLEDLKFSGGFPWDKNNDGHTIGPTPKYCHHYNWAVEELKKIWEVMMIGKNIVVDQVIIPAFFYHIRGRQY